MQGSSRKTVVLYVVVTTGLAVLALMAVGLAIWLAVSLLIPAGQAALERTFAARPGHLVVWAWIAALLAASGSLYLSEVMHFAPCSLCWYQRIAMYPLVVVLGVGMVTGDSRVWRYAAPLAGIGLAIAVYHVVIQWQPTLDAGVCTSGVPCTARYVAVWGFVSIPTMAASAFSLILAAMGALRFLGSDD